MIKHPVIVGLLGGFTLIVIAIAMGGQAGMFLSITSVLIVFGGTAATVVISSSWEDIKRIPTIFKVLLEPASWTPAEIINVLVSCAEKARREGLIALEDELDKANISDEFLIRAIQLVADGVDKDLIRNILETELTFIEDRHRQGKAMFETAGQFAPAFGMIGTLIGLVAMLADLQDPSSIGAGMATALLTTLYGSILANLFFNPIALALKRKTKFEIWLKEVVIEGVLSIQEGESPRIVEQKLKAFLAPSTREKSGRDARSGD